MTGWTADELKNLETADELEIASLRSDGTLGSQRTIWVVRVHDDLHVRSVNGRPTPKRVPGRWACDPSERSSCEAAAGRMPIARTLMTDSIGSTTI